MVLCEKAFINAIKHLLFCCYWCNGKNMTDATYGQFFWALSLPFILEKKEVLTFMLFLHGCWIRKKKKWYIWEDFVKHKVPYCMCYNSKANVFVMSKLDCVHTRLPAPGKQGLSVSSPYFTPRTKHCAWYTIGAGWISTGPDCPFGNRSRNFCPYKETIQGLLLFFSLKAQWHHCKSYQNRKWNHLSQTLSLSLETSFPVSWHPIETL